MAEIKEMTPSAIEVVTETIKGRDYGTYFLTIGDRKFEIQDIRLSRGEILADVFDANDDEKAIIGLLILDESEAESIAEQNDELSGFTDEMGRDGEHVTVDFAIPFEVYFEETDDEDRLRMYQTQITEAILEAIKAGKL